MPATISSFLAVLPLAALPAAATVGEPVPTGITAIGPSVIIFTAAAAVLLTLIFRAAARRVTRRIGERSGRARIHRLLRARSRYVLNDFLLPGAYGGLARIDHAVLVPGGIICIRTVHANGTVSGTENEPQWTMVDGAARRRFLNPLIQNEGRVRAVRKALPDAPVSNLVVFTGKVKFAAPPPVSVIRLDSLDAYIKKELSGPRRVGELEATWQRLNAAVLRDADSQKDFAAQISFS